MATTVQQAACNALAVFLANELSGVTVEERWPEPDDKLDLPTVSITLVGQPKDEHVETREVSRQNLDATTALIKWRVKARTQGVQLDVWAGSNAQRDDVLAQLDIALNKGELYTLTTGPNNGWPTRDGPLVQLADGHEGCYGDFTFDGPIPQDDSFTGREGEFRATIPGELGVVLVIETETPRLLSVLIKAKLSAGDPASADESTYTITADAFTHTE